MGKVAQEFPLTEHLRSSKASARRAFGRALTQERIPMVTWKRSFFSFEWELSVVPRLSSDAYPRVKTQNCILMFECPWKITWQGKNINQEQDTLEINGKSIFVLDRAHVLLAFSPFLPCFTTFTIIYGAKTAVICFYTFKRLRKNDATNEHPQLLFY